MIKNNEDSKIDWLGEDSIQASIDLSEAGDVDASWELIDALNIRLAEQCRSGCPYSVLSAKFTEALEQIWNQASGRAEATRSENQTRVSMRDLAPALSALGITRPKGRPQKSRPDDSVVWKEVEKLFDKLNLGALEERWLAKFFRELIQIRRAKGAGVTGNDLLSAFGCLHLCAQPGRPRDDDMTVMSALAREELARRSSSAGMARAQIASQEGSLTDLKLKTLRTKHPDIARIVSPSRRKNVRSEPWLTDAELKALADNSAE
ncbi:hypothetical protein GCM10027431_21510 [Lysobacter rhizosphaerae]